MKLNYVLLLAILFVAIILASGCTKQEDSSGTTTTPPGSISPEPPTALPGTDSDSNDNAAQQAKVEVIKSHAYVGMAGHLKAFAEIKNTGTVPVKFVEVAFNYTNAEGNPTSDAKLASVRILNPGDTAPASMTLDIGLSPEGVTATIAGFDLSDPAPYNKIIAVKQELSKPGGYARGSAYAENTGDIDWEGSFAVTTTYYDAQGNVVETGTSFFPFGLKKGEKMEFSTTVIDDSPLGISDFKVQIDYKD